MIRRVLGLLAAVLVVVAAAWLLHSSDKQMPDTTFNLIDGRNLTTQDLRGKSVLIAFWSISCETCKRDMPKLARLHETLADHKFEVIGVAMPHDPPPAVLDAVSRLKPVYPIALDVHGEVNHALGNIDVTPTYILVGPRGQMRDRSQGPLDENRVRATVLTF